MKNKRNDNEGNMIGDNEISKGEKKTFLIATIVLFVFIVLTYYLWSAPRRTSFDIKNKSAFVYVHNS